MRDKFFFIINQMIFFYYSSHYILKETQNQMITISIWRQFSVIINISCVLLMRDKV
jgi:sensor histidine kinase YesM